MKRPAIALCFLIGATQAYAQSPRESSRPFEIMDNSFLVEEAFNQEAGVFQNILVVQRPSAREWAFEFTQEWPLGGALHQLSYTLPLEAVKETTGEGYGVDRGTIALHYRLQALSESSRRPAFSPRISLLIPNFPDSDAQVGAEVNLPASKQLRDFYLHANAGYTVEGIGSEAGSTGRPFAAGSLIYRAIPMLHLMLESVLRAEEYGSEHSWLLSPGFRAGWNLGDKQLVFGLAAPVGLLEQDESVSFLLYFSYELPFSRQQ